MPPPLVLGAWRRRLNFRRIQFAQAPAARAKMRAPLRDITDRLAAPERNQIRFSQYLRAEFQPSIIAISVRAPTLRHPKVSP